MESTSVPAAEAQAAPVVPVLANLTMLTTEAEGDVCGVDGVCA